MVDKQTARTRDPTRRRQQLLATAARISSRADQSARVDSADNVGVAESGEAGRLAHRPQRRRPIPVTQTPGDYLDRRELLALVPLSMSTIDTLEKAGQFPSRFVLTPTVKVCWRRREIEKWLAERARKRVHQATEN